MAEYIDRQALIHVLNKEKIPYNADLNNFIINAPAADVQEVKRGKWILEREPNGKPYCFHCSVCDDDFHYIGITTAYDYCPNCGAKMVGGE